MALPADDGKLTMIADDRDVAITVGAVGTRACGTQCTQGGHGWMTVIVAFSYRGQGDTGADRSEEGRHLLRRPVVRNLQYVGPQPSGCQQRPLGLLFDIAGQ